MIEAIFSIPVLGKILVSLGFILVLNRLVKELWLAVLAGAFVLALWSGRAPLDALAIAGLRLISVDLLLLLAVIALIIIMSSQMSRAGIMKDLVEAILSRLSTRTAMASLAALIGLLPMPGGALFSAPLVADCDARGDYSPDLKVRLNYWFRHVLEPIWPLYPGIVLALGMSGVKLPEFLAVQLPTALAGVLAGWLFILRDIRKGEKKAGGPTGRIFVLLSPILVAVGSFFVIGALLPGLAARFRYLPLLIGLVAAIIMLQLMRPLAPAAWRRLLFKDAKVLPMVLLVIGIMIYSQFIESPLPGGGLLMDGLKAELRTFGIPGVALIFVLPFVAALTTGITVGFVGAAFPIVLALLGPSPDQGSLLAVFTWSYGAGFAGMMLSPIHLCFIVTNEYFKTSLYGNIARLIPPVLVTMAGTLAAGFAVSWLLRGGPPLL